MYWTFSFFFTSQRSRGVFRLSEELLRSIENERNRETHDRVRETTWKSLMVWAKVWRKINDQVPRAPLEYPLGRTLHHEQVLLLVGNVVDGHLRQRTILFYFYEGHCGQTTAQPTISKIWKLREAQPNELHRANGFDPPHTDSKGGSAQVSNEQSIQ